MVWTGERTGDERYSDPDELGEDELEEKTEEMTSTWKGRAILRLGIELVKSECSKQEDIKERIGNLLVRLGEDSSDAKWYLGERYRLTLDWTHNKTHEQTREGKSCLNCYKIEGVEKMKKKAWKWHLVEPIYKPPEREDEAFRIQIQI